MMRRSLLALAVSAICAPRGVRAGFLPADGLPVRRAPSQAHEQALGQFGYVSGDYRIRRVELNAHWMDDVVVQKSRRIGVSSWLARGAP